MNLCDQGWSQTFHADSGMIQWPYGPNNSGALSIRCWQATFHGRRLVRNIPLRCHCQFDSGSGAPASWRGLRGCCHNLIRIDANARSRRWARNPWSTWPAKQFDRSNFRGGCFSRCWGAGRGVVFWEIGIHPRRIVGKSQQLPLQFLRKTSNYGSLRQMWPRQNGEWSCLEPCRAMLGWRLKKWVLKR